jgi:hypothetical protein
MTGDQKVPMTQHTPGPWEVHAGAYWPQPGIDAVGRDLSIIVLGEAGEETGIHGRDEAEALANARLIAAAPEMLAALLDIKPIAQSMVEDIAANAQEGGEFSDTELRRWSSVLAAINKATVSDHQSSASAGDDDQREARVVP